MSHFVDPAKSRCSEAGASGAGGGAEGEGEGEDGAAGVVGVAVGVSKASFIVRLARGVTGKCRGCERVT